MSTHEQAQGGWMIYGANGYTGRLLAEEAVRRGMTPVLAGRREESVRPLAERLGLSWRAFALDDPQEVARNIDGQHLVLHCAGPFSATSSVMVEACVQARVSYLDITGEIEVLEAVFRQDAKAREAGIVLLPGVGFDVVPSDCLAQTLAQKLPGARSLTLSIMAAGEPSPGTFKTMIEGLPKGGAVRENGVVVAIPSGYRTRKVVFPSGERPCVSVPLGDVSTAFYSTGISNINAYMHLPAGGILFTKLARYLGPILGLKSVQKFLKTQIEKRVQGPNEEQRSKVHLELWAEVLDDSGARVSGTMITPEGYDCTVITALACVEQTLAGRAGAGAKTAAMAFGADFAATLPGITMTV